MAGSSLKATENTRRATDLVTPVVSVSEERRDDRQGGPVRVLAIGPALAGAAENVLGHASIRGFLTLSRTDHLDATGTLVYGAFAAAARRRVYAFSRKQ
jgi:hypothetical protein